MFSARTECLSFVYWPAKHKCELKTSKASDSSFEKSDEANMFFKSGCVNIVPNLLDQKQARLERI